MQKTPENKQTGGVRLVFQCVWYSITNRLVPFLAKNAVALLTFLYFLFILGTGGGVDISRMTDEQAVFRCAAGFVVWILGIALAQLGKELYRRRRQ